MNRRGFLHLFGAGVAGLAVAEAIPLGRVWSFPSWLLPRRPELLHPEFVSLEMLRILKQNLKVEEFFRQEWQRDFEHLSGVGWPISVRIPRSFVVRQASPEDLTRFKPGDIISIAPPLAANEPSVAAGVADPITRLARDGRPIGLPPIFDRASAFLESPREIRPRFARRGGRLVDSR